MKLTSTKIARGLYRVGANNRAFEIEDIAQASDGECMSGWMLYEMKETSCGESREYWNDFSTKRAAMRAIRDALL